MVFILFFLFIAFISFTKATENYESLTMSKDNSVFFVLFQFEEQGQIFSTRINQRLQKFIISEGSSNILKKNKILLQSTDIQLENKLTTGRKIENSVMIRGQLIPVVFYDVQISPKISFTDIGLGLSFKFEKEEDSILFHLKKQGIIEKYSYTLYPLGKKNEQNQIYFGGFPKSLVRGYSYKGTCNQTEESIGWSCGLKEIRLGSYVFKNHYEDHFQASEEDIKVPSEFMQVLRDVYLKEQIKSIKCMTVGLYTGIEFYKCNCKVIKDLPDITFVMNDLKFVFKPALLFITVRDFCVFKISTDTNVGEKFVFGTAFLNKLVSDYDYENKKITFYSKDVIIRKDGFYFGDFISKKMFFIICMFILSFGIALVLFKQVSKGKQQKNDVFYY